MKEFRLLFAHEIECRVNTIVSGVNGVSCSLLLYKDARVDMRLLDENCGVMNWKRSHEVIDGNLYCTISIWDDEKKQWVSRQDVGTESFTEKEKGQASDSFKRAGFNWGIGRELYTAPSIWVKLHPSEVKDKHGKPTTYARFIVSEIGYDENRTICKLVVKDEKGNVRYTFGNKERPDVLHPDAEENPLMDMALSDLKNSVNLAALDVTWDNYEGLHTNQAFRNVYMGIKKQLFEKALREARSMDELGNLWRKHLDVRSMSGMVELKDKRKAELSGV